ncbi:MAG: hypothetical protein ACK4YP_13790 [Myxococcota bacterium]
MKHEWNEALAAYDRELPLLQALRAEYLSYIRERLRAAQAAVAPEYDGRATIDVSTDADPDASAEVVLAGDRGETGVQCQLWSSADDGGEPGRYCWALLMPRSADAAETQRTLARVREVSNRVQTEAVDRCRPYDGFACVRWGRLELSAPDLSAQLTALFRSLLPAMETVADTLLQIRDASPPFWALRVLKRLRSDGGFTQEGATESRVGTWNPGPWVSARVSPHDWCWFTVANDGRVGLHWENRTDPASRKGLGPAVFETCPVWREQKWDGVLLVSPHQLGELRSANDITGLEGIVLDAWRRYRIACGAKQASA